MKTPCSSGFKWLVVVACFALACTGCLVFDKQTMVVFIPQGGKEVQALFVYHGLRASGKNSRDLKRAIADLTQLAKGETFYLGDPAVRIYLKPGKEDKPEPWDIEAMKVLNRHVVLGKGIFVTGKERQLSFCQPITVRDPQVFLTWINKQLGETILEDIQEEGKGKKKFARKGKERPPLMDKETMKMLEQAIKNNHTFLRLEPGRILFNLPGTKKFFVALKNDFTQGSLDMLKKDVFDFLDPATRNKVSPGKIRDGFADWEKDLKMIAEIPWSLEQRPKEISFALGWGDGLPFRLALEGGKSKTPDQFAKELLEHAKTLGATIRDDGTVEQVLKEFERNRKLPK